jgi:hypothetical protein
MDYALTKPATVAVDDDGVVMRNMGRRSQALVALVFGDIGGRERFAEWADKNPGDFYTKVFVKLMPRHIEVEEKKSVEDYLDEIDGGAATVLDDPPASTPAPPSGAGTSPPSGPAPLSEDKDNWTDEDWCE